MENITTGHWIFAGIFAVSFVVYLIWAYTKDNPRHKVYYKRAWQLLLSLIIFLFLIYVFKNKLK